MQLATVNTTSLLSYTCLHSFCILYHLRGLLADTADEDTGAASLAPRTRMEQQAPKKEKNGDAACGYDTVVMISAGLHLEHAQYSRWVH